MSIPAAPTQTRHPWRATARTVFEAVVAAAAAAPLAYEAVTQQDAATATGAGAVFLAVAGAITRVMAAPAVERWLRRFLPFLAANPAPKIEAQAGGPYDLDGVRTQLVALAEAHGGGPLPVVVTSDGITVTGDLKVGDGGTDDDPPRKGRHEA